MEVWRRFLWKAGNLVKSLRMPQQRSTFGEGRENTFSSAWPFNCTHSKGVPLWKATINTWHLWGCVHSALCLLYPVLPGKTSWTNYSSCCCCKLSLYSALPFLPPHLLQVLWALGDYFCDIAHSLNWLMEILGWVQIWYPDIWFLTAIHQWEIFLFDLLPWCCPSEENRLGNVQLKTFFPLWMSQTMCWQIVRTKRSPPDEQVCGGCPWVEVFFQQSLTWHWARWSLGPTSSSSWGASSSFSILSHVKGGLETLKNWKLILKMVL